MIIMDPVWAPRVLDNLTDSDLQLYLEFSGSPCIRGGGCSVYRALQVLYQAEGDIKLAIERLLRNNNGPTPTPVSAPASVPTPATTNSTTTTTSTTIETRETPETSQNSSNNDLNNNSISTSNTQNTDTHQTIWTRGEVLQFERLLSLHGKNFSFISRDMKSKTTKECVEYYYLHKRSCNRQKAPPTSFSHQQQQQQQQLNQTNHRDSSNESVNNVEVKKEEVEGTASKLVINIRPPGLDSMEQNQQPPCKEEQFPCKVCGRVFLKIKSRSAHMKRHKNER